jgi:hypothetical protein
MRRSASHLIAVFVVVGVMLSACSSPDRMAAPPDDPLAGSQMTQEPESEIDSDFEGETTSEIESLTSSVGGSLSRSRACPTQSSSASFWTVTNKTSIPIVLNADDYSCASWSGRSTPGNAFNNLALAPGESATVRLEYSVWTSDFRWTLGVLQQGTDEYLGRFVTEFRIHQGKTLPASIGGEWVAAPTGSQDGTKCSALKLGYTPQPETPGREWDGLNVRNQMVTFVVLGGRFSALADCENGDGRQTGNYASRT